MFGIGDGLHERSIVRQYLKTHEVWLETPWPSMFHDMPQVRLFPKRTILRTQAKNAARESDKYSRELPPINTPRLKVWYTHEQLRRTGSFVAAMSETCRVDPASFRLPIPDRWIEQAQRVSASIDKPLMIYRPLVERTEWIAGRQRNPDPAAYDTLFRSIRDDYFVVSVADLQQGKEWAVSHPIDADIEMHAGELDFETLAGLVSLADLVYTAPGFALILAQAVDTPVISIFGGHESGRFYDHGRPTDLLIDPTAPCECFSKTHQCDKRINIERAEADIRQFVDTVSLAQYAPCE